MNLWWIAGAFLVPIAQASPVERVGIVHEEQGISVLDPIVWDQVEKGLKRFLESRHERKLVAEAFGARPSWASEIDQRPSEGDDESLSREWEKSPVYQKVQLAQARSAWDAGEESRAKRLFEKALQWHPERKIAEGLRFVGMEKIAVASKSEVLGCVVDLEIRPVEASVSLEGFVFGGRRHFELAHGKEYRGWVHAEGFSPREIQLDCRRPGQWVEAFTLEQGRDWGSQELFHWRSLCTKQGLGGLYIFHPLGRERGGLSFYAPGFGVERVPLNEPLTVEALRHNPTALPVSAGTLSEMGEKHRPFLKVMAKNPLPMALPIPVAEVSLVEKKSFWWVAGVAGAAVLAGVLLKGTSSETDSTHGVMGSVD